MKKIVVLLAVCALLVAVPGTVSANVATSSDLLESIQDWCASLFADWGTGEGSPDFGTGEGSPDYGTGEGSPDFGTGEGSPDFGTGEGSPDFGTGEGSPD